MTARPDAGVNVTGVSLRSALSGELPRRIASLRSLAPFAAVIGAEDCATLRSALSGELPRRIASLRSLAPFAAVIGAEDRAALRSNDGSDKIKLRAGDAAGLTDSGVCRAGSQVTGLLAADPCAGSQVTGLLAGYL